jgi:hypothetical protein
LGRCADCGGVGDSPGHGGSHTNDLQRLWLG